MGERRISIRGVFDEETKRIAAGVAADAVSYGICIDFGLEVIVLTGVG